MIKNILDTLKQKPYLTGILIIIFILIIYLPSLNTYLMGDDFEWLNDSYTGWSNPTELLTPINNFFRPLVKLSYLLTYTLFKTRVFYYNAFTVLLHLLNVFLLYYLVFKITRRITPAALIALCYGSSALYSEVTLWSAGRPEALVLTFMLPPLILLSNPEEKITKTHHVLVFFFALCAAATKETWILLPFLAFAFLWLVKSTPFKTTAKRTLSLFVLLAVYLGYFIVLPKLSGKAAFTSYATSGLDKAIKKFGFVIYKYIGLENIYNGAAWQLLLVLVLLTAIAIWLIRRKNRLALWGLLVMLLTIGITFPIDHFPSRYSYLPLIGFWIMVVAWLEKDLKDIFKKYNIRTPAALLAIGVPIVFYLANQAIMLQWEIKDYHKRGASHKELVDMYLKVKDRIPHDRPIIFIDLGKRRAIDELTRSIQGYRKLLYARDGAIWQQVYLTPLANFAGEPFTEMMRTIPDKDLESLIQKDFTPLVFTDAGFFISGDYTAKVRDFFEKNRQLPSKVQALEFAPVKKER